MKNLKTIATAIIAVVLFTNTAAAQTSKSVNANEPFTVKYLGNENDYLFFQVEINTVNKNFSLLKIADKAEGELYSQRWKTNYKIQTFKIEKKEGQEISFRFLSNNKVYTKTFSANTSLKETTTVSENDMVVL